MNRYAEMRLSPRRNVAVAAQIVFSGGRARQDCVIRNLSEGGAKLEVASVSAIPNSFDLVLPRSKLGCRVVWRALREIGVQFV